MGNANVQVVSVSEHTFDYAHKPRKYGDEFLVEEAHAIALVAAKKVKRINAQPKKVEAPAKPAPKVEEQTEKDPAPAAEAKATAKPEGKGSRGSRRN